MESLLSFTETVSEPRISKGEEVEISSNDVECEMALEDVHESSNSEMETNESEAHTLSEGNPGWADAMAKILKTNKPKHKKTIVLAKAKKLQELPRHEKVKAELENGETEKEKKETEIKQETSTVKENRKLKKKLWENKGRVQPHILDKNREKALAKIATKGVVQLFNAVRQHQKKLDEQFKEVKNSELKKDKIIKSVDKKAFLDVLMGKGNPKKPKSDLKEEDENIGERDSVNKTWKVLQDDFMTGARLKDWDKGEVAVEDDIMNE